MWPIRLLRRLSAASEMLGPMTTSTAARVPQKACAACLILGRATEPYGLSMSYDSQPRMSGRLTVEEST